MLSHVMMRLILKHSDTKVPYGFRILDAVSCYMRLILKHSDTKRDEKTQIDIFFFLGGGGRMPVVPQPGSATDKNEIHMAQIFI